MIITAWYRAFRTRRDVQLACAVVGLVIVAFWCWGVLANSKRAALAGARDQAAVRLLAQKIQAWRKKPTAAQAQLLDQPLLNQQIERAAKAAGFAPGCIDRIQPEEPRRVADSPYKEVPVQIPVKGVSLRQLSLFLYTLTEDAAARTDATSMGGLRAQSIRISAPRGEDAGDTWRAELTLTYLVYSPAPTVARTTP